MQIEHKSLSFEVKALDEGGPGGFSGLGAVYGNIDSVGDIIAPGAFKDAIDRFLAEGVIGGLNHDWQKPVGHPVEARETAEGLWVKAVFHATPEAQAVREMMKIHPESGRATIRKLSIGYAVPKGGAAKLKGADEVKGYWKSIGYTPSPEDEAMAIAYPQVRLLKNLDLFEISPVVVPANRRASIAGAKFLDGGPATRPEFREHSRDVVSAIGEFVTRAESRLRARAKAGRVLSSANWTAMDEVCTALETGAGRLRKLLDDTQPAAKSDAIPPTGPEAEIPPAHEAAEAKAARVDPALVEAEFARYFDTIASAPWADLIAR